MRVLVIVAALGVSTGLAAAQPDPADEGPQGPPAGITLHKRARELARQWRHDGDRAKLEEAARLFKQVMALMDSPVAECDLGLALHYLGEDSRAHARLTRCMPRLAAASPDEVAGYRGVEDEVVAAVSEGHVAVDIATSPPGALVSISSFPADETVLAPTVVWLRPGSYTISAHVDGHRDSSWKVEVSEADAATRARKAWRVKLDPSTPVDVTVPPRHDGEPPPGLGASGPTGPAGPAGPVDGRPRSRTRAVLTLAAGGALLLGGGVVHYLSRDVRAELAATPEPAYRDKLGRWHTYQRATIGLYAAGAVATGVGAWLYLRARTPAPLAVSPTPEGRGAMLWLVSASR